MVFLNLPWSMSPNTLKLNPITFPNFLAFWTPHTCLGKNRNCSATAQVTLFFSAMLLYHEINFFADSTSGPTGFSEKTCLPAFSAASMYSGCFWIGRAMITPAMSDRASTSVKALPGESSE